MFLNLSSTDILLRVLEQGRGSEVAHVHVNLDLRECIWNMLQSRLSSQPFMVLPPWVFLHVGWSIPLVPPFVTASSLLAWNREAELKPTTFASLLLYSVFLSFLFS